MKRRAFLLSIIFLLLFTCFAYGEIVIYDDFGKVTFEKLPQRIISLYGAHTENLFSLGVEDKIVGVSIHEDYPPPATRKPTFSYRDDPEKLLSVSPDLVLIRKFVANRYPNLIKQLKGAGVKVVSLSPETLDDFYDYMLTLGKLTEKEERARELVAQFKKEVEKTREKTKTIKHKKRVFFESIGKDISTATPTSITAELLNIVGAENIAKDAKPKSPGSRIASFGIERLLAKADQIDIYIAQKGVMNRVKLRSIYERPGFSEIKAIKEKKVYIVDEKIVSRPTMRLLWGIEELGRIIYPEIFCDISSCKKIAKVTRAEAARMFVIGLSIPLYVPNYKSYSKKKAYKYGSIKDVPWTHPYSRYIETLAARGIVKIDRGRFYPERILTREEVAKWLYMVFDFDEVRKVKIEDEKECRYKFEVETIVNAGVMDVEDGKFYPNKEVSGKELVDILKKARELGKK